MKRNATGQLIPPRNEELPTPHQAPQLRDPVPGREVPTNSGCGNFSGDCSCVRQRAAGFADVLKGPIYELTH